MHCLCLPFLFFPLSFSLPSPLPSTSLLFPLTIPSLSPTLSLLHALRGKGQLIFLPPPLISCTLVHRHRPPYQDCLSTPWKPGLIGKRSHLFFHSPNAPKRLCQAKPRFHPETSIIRETAEVTCHPEGDIQTCCFYLDMRAWMSEHHCLQSHTLSPAPQTAVCLRAFD